MNNLNEKAKHNLDYIVWNQTYDINNERQHFSAISETKNEIFENKVAPYNENTDEKLEDSDIESNTAEPIPTQHKEYMNKINK